jgi:hypothetical protein
MGRMDNPYMSSAKHGSVTSLRAPVQVDIPLDLLPSPLGQTACCILDDIRHSHSEETILIDCPFFSMLMRYLLKALGEDLCTTHKDEPISFILTPAIVMI